MHSSNYLVNSLYLESSGRSKSMFQNIYITGAESQSGKSLVVLGMMEMLRAMTPKVGFFRPVIASSEGPDPLIHLIRKRYQISLEDNEFYGCRSDVSQKMMNEGKTSELIKLLLAKYKAMTGKFDVVVCAGTDFVSSSASRELDFNAQLARNFGCLLIPVIKGNNRTAQDIANAARISEEYFEDAHCSLLATFVNRTPLAEMDAVREVLQDRAHPIYLLPERPVLENPTVKEIARALKLQVLHGNDRSMNHAASCIKVAAMYLHDFIPHLEERSLVLTPGDRSDIILGTVLANQSRGNPPVAGIVLTGNQKPSSSVTRVLNGLEYQFLPILLSPWDTYTTSLKISEVKGNILPSDERKIATALGLIESSVDMQQLGELLTSSVDRRVTPLMFEYELIQRAKTQRKHIVLPEGTEERVLRAAELLCLRNVVDITLLGNRGDIEEKVQQFGLKLHNINIIDPHESGLHKQFAETYYELRKHRNITMDMALDTMFDVSYFGTMMVHLGYANGMVSGAAHTTQHTIRPAFEIIKTRPGCSLVSSVFLMCLEDRVLVYGDCVVNPNPNSDELADIAVSSAETALMFGIEPRVAMLSYSTGASGKGVDVEFVREGVRIAQKLRPDLKIEGPIQYDAAVDSIVAESKLPESEVAGKATVFIFPDLNTGNNTYKAVQRSANAVAVGPVLQGLNKPVNDLSRGCTVTDIVNTVAITAIQAQIQSATAVACEETVEFKKAV